MIFLDEYLDNAAFDLKNVPGVADVQLFGGEISDEDIDKLRLPSEGCAVLMTGVGGPVSRIMPDRLEVDAVFGAYVVSKTDSESLGYGRQSLQTAQQIAGAVVKNSASWAKGSRTNVASLTEIAELTSSIRRSSRYSIWYVVWQQRVAIKLTP